MCRLALSVLLLTACTSSGGRPVVTTPVRVAGGADDFSRSFGVSTPAAQGMDNAELLKLTTWLRDNPYPIYSLLISRNGKLVYELYTSSFGREEAHYVMSVTKSVLSALVGIATDRRFLRGADASIVDVVPHALIGGDDDVERLRPVTIKKILGMAVFDAPDPPRDLSADALARQSKLWSAPNRIAAALRQPLLQEGSFQYNDSTPMLAAAAVRFATKGGVLEFAETALFRPLGFRNYEWMHQDKAGIDNGGYGLRLRPIDMQKLGVLYLHQGVWNGEPLISRAWVERSFTPWTRSEPQLEHPNYGWFWWTYDYASGWTARVAKGWKGQRIVVLPEQAIVITMTGCIEDGSDDEFIAQLVTKVVKPAVEHGPGRDAAVQQKKVDDLLMQVRNGASRISDFVEYRMVPSVTPKAKRKPLAAQ